MELMKFTIVHGLEFLLLGLLLALAIIYIFYCIGAKKQQKDYDMEYKYLKFVIENSEVNAPTKEAIEKGFEEINRFSCCNREQLQVLEQNFYKKFKI